MGTKLEYATGNQVSHGSNHPFLRVGNPMVTWSLSCEKLRRISSKTSPSVSVSVSVDGPLHKIRRTLGVSRYMHRDDRPAILLLKSSNLNSQTKKERRRRFKKSLVSDEIFIQGCSGQCGQRGGRRWADIRSHPCIVYREIRKRTRTFSEVSIFSVLN